LEFRRHYIEVAASSSSDDDYTVPNGKTLEMISVGGNAASSPDTEVCVVWDPGGAQEEVVFVTHGDDQQDLSGVSYVGDGTRIMRIRLINDEASAEALGGWWRAELI
jgi:hypothetical protein